MATIPRYFSEPNATPAINTVKADPNLAGAPYRAAGDAIAHVVNNLQGELQGWDQVLKQKQREQQAAQKKSQQISEGLYKAQAMGQVSLAMGDIQRRALASADGNANPTEMADQEFQKLADSVILNAPTDESKLDLTKRLIGARTHLYSKISDESIKVNNQVNMNKLEGMLSQYEAGAATNPESVDELKTQSKDIFDSMTSLGLPASAKLKIQDKFHKALDYHAAAAQAEQDPFLMKQKLEAGELSVLGAASQEKLKHIINSSLRATTAQAKSALSDAESRIMSGLPLPEDFASRAQLAAKAGLHSELEDVTRLVDVSKLVQNSTLSDLLGVSADLKQQTASGNMAGSPNKIKKLIKFVDTSAKALKEDPFSYAENQGRFQPFNTITDFTNVSPDELQKRNYRALQIQESLGVESPALKKEELKIAAAQLESLPAEEKSKVLANLSSMGDTTIRALSKLVDKKDGGLAQAIRMHQVDPELSLGILKGRDIIKNKQGPTLHKDEVASAADQALKTLVVDDPELRNSMVHAGVALHARDTAEGATPTLKESIAKANNLLHVDRNGMFSGIYSTVAPAPGMKTKDLDSLVDENLTSSEAWKQYAQGRVPARTEKGLALPSNRFKPSDFDYVSTKPGAYKMMYEGSPVLDVNGQPISVDLRKLHKDKSPVTK